MTFRTPSRSARCGRWCADLRCAYRGESDTMCPMRTRVILGAAAAAVVAGTAGTALASSTPGDDPTGPCPITRPTISVTNVDTRVTFACTTIVIPVALPHPALGEAPACLPNAWISGSYLYVEVNCKAPIAIPIPITGSPPGA